MLIDYRELGDLMLRLFGGAGYTAELARDGQAGLHRALTRRYDLLIINRGLPAIEGLNLLGRLRRSGNKTPAVILTALGTVADRVAGLDGGAEDYVLSSTSSPSLRTRRCGGLSRFRSPAARSSCPQSWLARTACARVADDSALRSRLGRCATRDAPQWACRCHTRGGPATYQAAPRSPVYADNRMTSLRTVAT
ncbi:response regulator [Actinoplanes sp. NPDC051411]|uniref:response regulator n=1 Tax=Actinoplanes sp. NPDC051411 TaxID=3155522 RepID=UPI003424CC96